MKTKDLIKELQKADPSGETHAAIGNSDIMCVERLPAYYDGSLQVISYNEKGYPVSAKYHRKGEKVSITSWAISDIIGDRQNFEIDYSELHETTRESTKKWHDEIRDWHKKLDLQLELENFYKFVRNKIKDIEFDDKEQLKAVADKFYTISNMSPKDPFPANYPIYNISYIEKRQRQWEETIDVTLNAYTLRISRKDNPEICWPPKGEGDDE